MTTATEHHYVVIDDQILGGESVVRDTRTPVRAIVELWRQGVSAEEIQPRAGFRCFKLLPRSTSEINAHIERNRVPDELVDPLVRVK